MIKKYYGFVLNIGYAEDSQLGTIIIRHMGDGFSSAREALTELSHYLFDGIYGKWENGDLVHDVEFHDEIMDDFSLNLRSFHNNTAVSWDTIHANAEEWWTWDLLSENYPKLSKFWENTEALHDLLPMYLDAGRLKDIELGDAVIAHQQANLDRAPSIEESWACVNPKIKHTKTKKK